MLTRFFRYFPLLYLLSYALFSWLWRFDNWIQTMPQHDSNDVLHQFLGWVVLLVLYGGGGVFCARRLWGNYRHMLFWFVVALALAIASLGSVGGLENDWDSSGSYYHSFSLFRDVLPPFPYFVLAVLVWGLGQYLPRLVLSWDNPQRPIESQASTAVHQTNRNVDRTVHSFVDQTRAVASDTQKATGQRKGDA